MVQGGSQVIATKNPISIKLTIKVGRKDPHIERGRRNVIPKIIHANI